MKQAMPSICTHKFLSYQNENVPYGVNDLRVCLANKKGDSMGDRLIMSKKERDLKVILEQVKVGQLNYKDGAKRLRLSCKQIGRILKKYKTQGDAGLIHQSRGKPSSRAYSQVMKDHALDLYCEKYMNFGPTFAMEKMFEEDASLTMHHGFG
jgi:hypothetical protein